MPFSIENQAWCGVFDAPWVGRSISPCYLETAAAFVSPIILAGTLLVGADVLRHVATLKQSGGHSKGATTAVEGLTIAGSLFLLSMHALHLGLALFLPSIR